MRPLHHWLVLYRSVDLLDFPPLHVSCSLGPAPFPDRCPLLVFFSYRFGSQHFPSGPRDVCPTYSAIWIVGFAAIFHALQPELPGLSLYRSRISPMGYPRCFFSLFTRAPLSFVPLDCSGCREPRPRRQCRFVSPLELYGFLSIYILLLVIVFQFLLSDSGVIISVRSYYRFFCIFRFGDFPGKVDPGPTALLNARRVTLVRAANQLLSFFRWILRP